MKTKDIINIFQIEKAILKGHFILTSGKHSRIYFQKANIFMKPELTEKLCIELSKKILLMFKEKIYYTVGLAIGSIIPAYETARYLKISTIWLERENNLFTLKRFKPKKNVSVVLIEDIITTGTSIIEAIKILDKYQLNIIAVACIINRSIDINLNIPIISLANVHIDLYDEKDIPEDLKRIPAIKLGSRNI